MAVVTAGWAVIADHRYSSSSSSPCSWYRSSHAGGTSVERRAVVAKKVDGLRGGDGSNVEDGGLVTSAEARARSMMLAASETPTNGAVALSVFSARCVLSPTAAPIVPSRLPRRSIVRGVPRKLLWFRWIRAPGRHANAPAAPRPRVTQSTGRRRPSSPCCPRPLRRCVRAHVAWLVLFRSP